MLLDRRKEYCMGISASLSRGPEGYDGNMQNENVRLGEAAYESARKYYRAASILAKADSRLMSVICVNYAFACELFLKAILYKHNITPERVHSLSDLFAMLPDRIQREIKAKAVFQYESPEDFDAILKFNSNAFGFIRYAHEKKAFGENFDGIFGITRAAGVVAKQYFK
jgi:hypothetical protein